MKNKTYLFAFAIFLSVLLVASASATAINRCFYDAEPHFDYFHKLSWVCEVSQATNCVSYIKENNLIIQTNPNIEYTKDVGEISTFSCNAVCNVEFDTNLLIDNKSFIFGVACENSTFEATIYPQLYLFEQQGTGRMVWIKNNIHYIIGGFIVSVFAIAFIILLLAYFKKYS
jgi:hypothetical protein